MMNEWIISSSLLIAAVLLGRLLLRGRISLRLQYALWAVALVRLLLPVQIFTSDFGAGSIAREVNISAPVQQVYVSVNEDHYEREYETAYRQVTEQYRSLSQSADPVAIEREAAELARTRVELDLSQILYLLWFAGMAVMAAVIISCNIHLTLQLKRRRWALDVPDSLLPVFITGAVPTPCLYGLFRPVIYLTPEAAKDAAVQAHVLEHELTHYRHGDHLWSLLRSICLVLHWYNPLVWIAAKVSRADAELACDEGALARLGEDQRGDYGRTLIGLTCSAPFSEFFLTATTMTGSAGSIRERIKLLMVRPRNTVLTLTAAILMVTLIVGCTFAGAPETTEPIETEPEPPGWTASTTDPQLIAYFDKLLNPQPEHGEGDWYPRALTSFYEDPARIDLFQLFYNGIPGADNSVTAAEQSFLETCSGYNPEFDLVRIPATEMDRVLQQYFGIPLEQTDKTGLENFLYWEEGDCYYHSHTDTNLQRVEIIGVVKFENGRTKVTYTNSSAQTCAVILDEDQRIISNLETRESGNSAAPLCADFAGEDFQAHHTYRAEDSEYLTSIAFTATEQLLGVKFGLLRLTDTAGWQMEELDSFPFIQPGYPFLAQVPFRGDTTYGIRFTDARGQDRRFAVSISGEDGSLVCTEYSPVYLGLTDADGILVFPGTRWNMTMEEVLAALNITQYEQLSYRTTIRVAEMEVLGQMAEVTFDFIQYTNQAEPGLSHVRVTYLDTEASDPVLELLTESIDPAYAESTTEQPYSWSSLSSLANLVSREAYSKYKEQHPSAPSSGFPASTITWEGRPALTNSIVFSAPLTEALQLQATDSLDQTAEVAALFAEGGDPDILAALTFLWSGYSDMRDSQQAAPFTPEIIDCVQVAEDQVLVYYRRPGSEQLYAADMTRHADRWTVANNLLVVSMADYADRSPRPLSQKEMDQVTSAFTPSIIVDGVGTGNPAACMVNSYYSDVRDLDLWALLYNFPTTEDGTQEEYAMLLEKYGDDFLFSNFSLLTDVPVPLHRYRTEDIDAVLRRYAGIGHSRLTGRCSADSLFYLEQTDSYYNFTSDFGLLGFHCIGGWVYDGGAVLVSSHSALYLTEQNGQYYIQAHLPAMVMTDTSSHAMIPAE